MLLLFIIFSGRLLGLISILVMMLGWVCNMFSFIVVFLVVGLLCGCKVVFVLGCCVCWGWVVKRIWDWLVVDICLCFCCVGIVCGYGFCLGCYRWCCLFVVVWCVWLLVGLGWCWWGNSFLLVVCWVCWWLLFMCCVYWL